MFLINSRLGLFTAADFRRLPFSRSYGVILQSSLTMVLPLVLQFSCRLPVSVCGTGTFRLFSSFSRQREFIPFATSFHSTSSPGLIGKCTSLLTGFTICARLSITAPGLSFCVTASFKRLGWYRNIYLLSIRYAFRPLLSPRLTPRADEPSPGNLRLSTIEFLTPFSLLMPAFSLVYSPPLLPLRLLPIYIAPLPIRVRVSLNFGVRF